MESSYKYQNSITFVTSNCREQPMISHPINYPQVARILQPVVKLIHINIPIYVQVNKKNCAKLKRQCRDDKLQSEKGPKQDRDDVGLESI